MLCVVIEDDIASSDASIFVCTTGGTLWTLTQTMKSAIDSWSARTTCAILSVKRGAEVAMDQWWRRLHRVGDAALNSRDQSLSNMAERLIHRWGGHVARFPTNQWLAEVVRARAVQCLRWAQQRHTDMWTGGPPEEIQNLPVGGSVVPLAQRRVHEEPREKTGWWKDAQDRLSWRRAEQLVQCELIPNA